MKIEVSVRASKTADRKRLARATQRLIEAAIAAQSGASVDENALIRHAKELHTATQPVKCDAIFNDYKNATVANTRRPFVCADEKICDYRAKVRVGHLRLCARHAQLALDGLVMTDGTVHDRQTRADVRKYPDRFPNGMETWHKNKTQEPL